MRAVYAPGPQWLTAAVTANATADLTRSAQYVDATAGDVTLTLPLASGTRQPIVVTRIDSTLHLVRVAPTLPDTIQGDTDLQLSGQWASVTLGATSSGWAVINAAAIPEQSGIIPTDLPGLDLWLKASALGLADTTAIQTYTDQSGVGNSPTQATLANRPLYRTGVVNGLPAARFDGSNDLMARGSIAHVPTWTVFGCFVARGGAGAIRWLFTKSVDSSSFNLAIRAYTSNFLRAEFTTGAFTFKVATSTTAIVVGTPYIFVATWDGTSLLLYINGRLEAATVPGTTPDQVGSIYTLGGCNGEGVANVWNGDVPELGVYRRGVAPLEAFGLARYLSRTYGVVLA